MSEHSSPTTASDHSEAEALRRELVTARALLAEARIQPA